VLVGDERFYTFKKPRTLEEIEANAAQLRARRPLVKNL
jgi:hypothetical protein